MDAKQEYNVLRLNDFNNIVFLTSVYSSVLQ